MHSRNCFPNPVSLMFSYCLLLLLPSSPLWRVDRRPNYWLQFSSLGWSKTMVGNRWSSEWLGTLMCLSCFCSTHVHMEILNITSVLGFLTISPVSLCPCHLNVFFFFLEISGENVIWSNWSIPSPSPWPRSIAHGLCVPLSWHLERIDRLRDF